MIKIEDMMTRSPHTLLRSHSLQDAKNLMAEHDIRHVPIIDTDSKLLGVISQRDVLATQESVLTKETQAGSFTLATPIDKVMVSKVIAVSPKAGLRESAIYMQKHKIGCLPVVEHGKLVGIITDTDFVGIAINLLEIEEDTEPEKADL
ncbi:acetoin utilization protein AcuB [Vibrio sp. vnigr-6D03]|uniref:CBS domain-containing protein n=1 Tax=Vibrio sp. vnigr-6D03 TaxID=2058088 RepID=UPI000C31F200|nr:CBS domain-containing protein [Vibrio sp. vnigr-6D03]PKF81030.1 acetoin utilization protein AcuB [Vibrio sp. vnigr-6D03]